MRPVRSSFVLPLLLACVLPAVAATGGAPADPPAEKSKAPAGHPWGDAVDRAGRPEADRKRDADRKPAEVLEFLQIRPGMRVGEFAPGDGYYSEIVAQVVGPEGKLYVHATGLADAFRERLDARLERMAQDHVAITLGPTPLDPGYPEALDAVLLIRGYHDYCYMGVNLIELNDAVYKMLKPGGVFGVVDHRSSPGAACSTAWTLHRVDPWLVEYQAILSGFLLEEASEILANPDDHHALSSQRDDGAYRDRTDRFVFRFRKPLEEPSDDGWDDEEEEAKPAKPSSEQHR